MRRALEIREKVLGPTHPDTAVSLNNQAALCFHYGEFIQAEQLLLRAIDISLTGQQEHCVHVNTYLINLLMLWLEQESDAENEKYYHNALGVIESLCAPDRKEISSCLNNLALLYAAQGHYDHAEVLCIRALAIREQVLGSDHPDTAVSLNNLAGIYQDQAKYDQADDLYRRALAISEMSLGSGHPGTGTCLNNLATLQKARGNYIEAEALHLRALAIHEQVLGSNHPSTANSFNNLAVIHKDQGQHARAEALCRRALAIREKSLGTEHPDTASSLSNLAVLQAAKGNYEEAESLHLRALAIRERVLGGNHPDIAVSLNNLAEVYQDLKQHDQAEDLYRRALAIRNISLGPEHPETATCLNNLATLQKDKGDYAQAENLHRRALLIRDQVLGRNHPDTAVSLNNLAAVLWVQGQHAEANSFYALAILARTDHLLRSTPFMPLRHRLLFFRQYEWDRFAIFGLAAVHQPAIETALWTRLNRHGLLQEVERNHRELLGQSGASRDLVQNLSRLIAVGASASLSPLQRSELREKQDRRERELYQLVPELTLKPVAIADVALALTLGSALVEFEHVPSLKRYLAIILRKDGSSELIDLCRSQDLEQAIEAALLCSSTDLADAVDAWAEVSQMLIAPLLHRLADVHHWCLSLDGVLHRVPFAALPWPDGTNQWLTDHIEISILTSGRDLIRLQQQTPHANSEPLVVANPDFEAGLLGSPGSDLPASHRSVDMASLTHWQPLSGTAVEGQQLAALLDAQLLQGRDATTLNLQAVARPLVLHAATHGYFLPDQPPPDPSGCLEPWQERGLLQGFRGEDPMLRSGLVLAGANHPDANPHDDGYLTAQEATQLDLRGTELVTLSACDTGRGDIHNGEGVYGLQRALTVAGARSMLLSLWKVPDNATCEFMLRFYTLLKQGTGRYAALVETQRAFREHENILWRDHHYWAAWQLIGDWRPIQGL